MLRVLAMTFVKHFALRAAQSETETTYHPAVAKFVQYAQLPVYLSMSLGEIVRKIPYSYPHLNRLVMAELHCSAGKYLQRKKLEYACKLLTCTDRPLQAVSEALGFSDYAHFSAFFKKNVGLSPARYQKERIAPYRETRRNRRQRCFYIKGCAALRRMYGLPRA